MKQKSTLTLDKEFILYCEINNIDDINKLANETFSRGFSLLKYGETPFGELTKPKEIIKEIQVEVIKEVEKIVYVDKIVEIPVIKEVVKEVLVEVIKEVIKEIPIEVIKEVKVEVPVEIIKEVEIPIQVKGKTKVVTKEIIKEVPIEVIKEIEIIKEVPIEVIKEVIKEVKVEVIKEIINTDEINRLTIENEKLKKELETITNSLGKFNKGKFMKNSDLSNLYDE